MNPIDLPEGVSPECPETVFVPGSAKTRPALNRLFQVPFASGGPNNLAPTIVYGKSFVTPAGDTKNLWLDSNGNLWASEVGSQTRTLLLSSTPGSYCRSVTAFGREYIAISDGLHGQEVPLQYDGTTVSRVTQDGPGAAASVISVALPPVSLANATTSGTAITSIQAIGPYVVGGTTYYSLIGIQLTGLDPGITLGEYVAITGNSVSAFNIPGTIVSIGTSGGNTNFALSYNQTTGGTGTGGSFSGPAAALVRSNNTVTGSTATAHGLQVGYQVQISGTQLSVAGTSITSIVIDNEDNPGLALVTTATPHGLLPNNDVVIQGIPNTPVGGAITSAVRYAQVATITTTTPHGLGVGSGVDIAGVANSTFDGQYYVSAVPSPTTFQYAQVDTDVTTPSSGGTVNLIWPLPSADIEQNTFTVQTAPTATTFTIQLSYTDGTWSGGGTASFGWDGIFYVTAVLSSTSFQYQQYGPAALYIASGTPLATPYGQAAPGLHLMQVLFLIGEQKSITQPGPFVDFIANGGQYVQVSNIPIGPSNCVGRILAFTGAQPNVPEVLPPFFYIPVPAQVEGLTVATATQINDNTTTSVLLDFSDNTLFAALGISIPGNNLVNQDVLDSALGFAYFENRLTAFGQRNVVQNFLNMGFDGGYLPSAPTVPAGWNASANVGGSLNGGHFGEGWLIVANAAGTFGKLSQSAYQDAYGDPILSPSTPYNVRVWLDATVADVTFTVTLASVSTGFTSTATIAPATGSGWYDAALGTAIPVTVPSDLILTLSATFTAAGHLTVDEFNLINGLQPYLDNTSYTSYLNNPEGMDGVSGVSGPANDTRKIMDYAIRNDSAYCLTQDPSGRLHEINVNTNTEPSGWVYSSVAANCGALSAFCTMHSQADDETAGGGDDWFMWASEGGALIFGGGMTEKISQEIQPNWNDPTSANTQVQINMQAATSIFAVNDPVSRAAYFFLPIGDATAPSAVYAMSYRELNSAYAIANSPPFHPSLAGRLIATDNTRKWSPYYRALNGAARMYTSAGQLEMVFFAGNGVTPGQTAGYGNVYTLNPELYTDDDYGQIDSYYVTSFFLDAEKAAALQLGSGRHMVAYLQAFVAAVGNITVYALCDSMTNVWPLSFTRQPGMNPTYSIEGACGEAMGERIAFMFMPTPLANQTDNGYNLQRLTPWFRDAKMKVRGAA